MQNLAINVLFWDKTADRMQATNPQCNYKEKPLKWLKDVLATFLGVLLALAANMYYDYVKDRRTYENTVEAIQAEAKGNEIVLRETFDSLKFENRPVFRDLNTDIVENSLSNNTFIERADSTVISQLFKYMLRLKQLNAHRAGLEKLYLEFHTDSLSNTRIGSYKDSLITRIKVEVESCKQELPLIEKIGADE